jgi:VCBS repeat-containing protein
MDVKNSDIANGSVIASLNGADVSASSEAAAMVQLAIQAGNIMPLSADGQLVLPAGVGIDDIKVVGRDLIFQMPDGTQMIVPDGAVFVPQIVVDGVAVPALNIAALLIGQEPQPAAGRPQSSGGNFSDAVGDIGDPFALGDLLPPTALAFPEPELREVVPGLIDRDPEVVIQDGGPAGRDVVDNVSETGLPGSRANGNIEAPGSTAGNGSDSTTGTIFVTSLDGIASININGVTVTGVAGQQITTPRGILTLSALNGDQIGYTYRLTDNTSGDATTDVFTVTLTDPDGDVASARLTINIADDVPTARNDIDSLAGGTFGPVLGNVLSGAGATSGPAGADTLGADGASISGVRAGASGTFAAFGTTINGQYGTLTLGANGNYTYVRNVNTPGGVTDVFTYQLTDGDGDTSSATLTIDIGDAPSRITFIPGIGDDTIVREPHLPAREGEPAGSQFDGNAETTGGTITFNSPDGVGSVTVSGVVMTPGALPQQVTANATGTLVITGYTYNPVTGVGSITYVYTLNDNTVNTNGESLSFPIEVTDLDGDVANDKLVINIVDDAPLAVNDSATQLSENAPIFVNVFVNDTPGADGVSLNNGVAVVAGSLTGAGSLLYNNNGSFTYTPAPSEEGVVKFQYTITDGDGDTSTATVTINLLEDSIPQVDVAGGNVVDEAGLPVGSKAAANSETTSGTIATATGGDTLASLMINGVNVTAGGTVVGASGTLTVLVSEGSYSYSYTLTDNTSGDSTTDSFTVVITDSDGDSANDTLVISIQDDVPAAADDTDTIAAGTYGPATGNVITDAEGDGGTDTPGADGASVTAVTGSAAGTVNGSTNGTYGVLTLNTDGSYSYARNAGTAGGVSDVFTYTLTDGDGDTSTATLTISIANSPTTLDLPTGEEDGTRVAEAGLPAGSDAASTSETTSGTIAYTAPDGPATVTIDGVAVTSVGQTFTGSFGTLTVTSIGNGSVGYSYTLTTNTSGDATSEDFALVISDQDGDTTSGTLVIDIVDDVPTARADVDSVTEDGSTVADGNVITGANVADANTTDGVADTRGADGATVTAIGFGATVGTVGTSLAGTYGTLTMNADGRYSYALNNDNPAVQGLDGDDTLTEVFTYTITDGDGDPSTTSLTVTINGSDDPITINGLNAEGPDRIVDEDDLSDGSSPNAAALTQNGTFTVNGVDGIASIKIGGTETSVGQSFTTAYGTFEITSISLPVDGTATAITVGYRYVLTDNTAHANATGQNFITELFDVAVTDTDGSIDTDQVEVRIIDDVPTAVNDTDTVAGGSNAPATGNVITDAEMDGGKDTAGADGVLVTAITGVSAGTVGGATSGTYGVLTLNANGSYSYVRNDGTPGNVQDVFNYQVTDSDGDTSTATLTITIQDDRPFVGANAIVLLDDDALTGGNPGGTGDDVNAANVTGTLSGSGGDGALTFAYQLTGAPLGFTYVSGPSGSVLVQQGSTTVLTITLNTANGAYTVVQNAPILHAAGGNENNAPFTLNYTVTDVDGDAASGTLAINVDDDTPLVSSIGAVPTLTVDETVLATNATASFAGLFTTNYGADGAGSTAYTLGVVAGPSGLVDTATGQAVNLSLNGGGVVEGRTATSNELVFTVAVNGAGSVTLDQIRAVVHSPNTGPDQSTSLSAANLITLTATLTDGDGDTASATANIANALVFKDDGPAIDAAVVDANTVLLTTQDAETILGAFDTAVSTANFGGAFSIASSAYGADGAGTTTWAYALSVTDANTGLTSNGVAITLTFNAGIIEGRAGGQLIFTLATNPTTGVVTLTQLVEIDHAVEGTTTAPFDDQFAVLAAGKVALTGTATIADKDSDSASEAVVLDLGGNVRFADDGPTVTLSATPAPTLTVDETVLTTDASGSFAGLFTTNFGADGAGTTAYTLGVVAGPSGLLDVATGQAVNLSLNGGVVEGRTSGSNALVFTVTVNGSGVVTLDQQRAVSHLPNTNADQPTSLSAANLVTLTATSTDGDGDTASATANIANALVFKDDGPAIDIAASGSVLIVDESLSTGGSVQNEGGRANNDETLTGAAPSAIGFAQGSIVSLVSANAGADGEASRQYALNVNNVASGLQDSVTNSAIVLVSVNATTVEGRVGSSAGAVSFRIAIDPAAGAATINQFRAVEHNDSTNHDENGGSEALMNTGALSLGITLTDRDGDQATDNVDISQLFKFEDDGPVATGESGTTNEILKDFNTAFVIDFSGSIDNAELNTQLVAVKAAINELFGSTGGSVSVKFVLFAANAMASATFTSAAAANTYLDSVNPATGGARPSGALGNTTDFSAAITTLLANYAADETADNQVFFLSDGNPNENLGSSGQALNNTIRPLWNSFVNNNDINVTAIGVGDGINNSNLQQIDVDGAGAPILVANFDDLIATLVSLFTPTPITGDLDVNDDFGTDGGRILAITVPTAAAVDPVYTWNGLSGAASQITVSGGGATINGFTSILVGTELGGQFVIDFATGQWSYTPPRNVPADRTETFNYTIVDGDGDTASAALNVLVENNDPPATAAVTATVDDDALTGGIAGGTGDLDANAGDIPASASEAIYNGTLNVTATDNPVAAISFAQLQGATAVIGQETVTYSWNAVTNLLTANISVSPAGRTGTTLFTVQLNNPSSGSYTVTLVDNVLHSNVAGENDGTVALTYRVVDTDGSTNSGTLNITFDDDTPLPISPAAVIVVNGASGPVTGSLDIDSSIANNVGADGGAVQFSPTLNGLNSGLTSNFVPIIYTVSGNQLVGKAGAATVFTVTLNSTTSQYTVDMDGKIDSTATIDFNSGLYNFVGGNNSWSEFIPLAESVSAPINNNSKDLLLTPSISGAPNSTINSTANTGGIGGGASVGATETFRVDFVTDVRGNPADGSGNYGTAGNRDHVFDGHYTVNGASALFKSSGGSTVKITAFDDPDGNNVVGDGAKDTINGMTIAYLGVSSALIIPTTSSANYTINGQSFSVIRNADGSVTVGGVAGEPGSSIQGTVIAVFTANGYNSVEYTYQSGDTSQIGDFGATTLTNNPVNFSIPVQIIDADGDVTALSNLSITANSTPPVVLDLDGDGVEFVATTAGVSFDYAGDGRAETTAWVGADDGLLVLDRNGDSLVNNGSEIVFARDGLTDLQGLAADYDSNRDGVLDVSDVGFAKFGVWQDANSNGVTDTGEYRSLTDAGIVRIGLVSDDNAYAAANGQVSVTGQSLYAKSDGSTGIVADAAFATGGAPSAVSRTSDPMRTSNVTSSVIAAALVGLAVEEDLAAAPDSNLAKYSEVVSEGSVATSDFENSTVDDDTAFAPMAVEPTHDFEQHTGDIGTSTRAADDVKTDHSFSDAPTSQMSDLLGDSNDAVSGQTSGAAFNFGGDQVMHSMLDMAAFPVPVETGENAAGPLPTEDAVREAMPDLMVDRLIDAFTAKAGTPANDVGEAAGDSELLAGMLDQGIDAFHISAMTNNDISGSHQYDMASINHG